MRLALAAVAALALVAAGCGGVESEPNLAQAAERTESVASFAYEQTTRSTLAGETFRANCDGVVDNTRERSRFSCAHDMGAGALELITVGDTSYTRDPSGNGKWTRQPGAYGDPLNGFGPNHLLDLLRPASSKTERVGTEEVRGESTVHYRLTVDCKQVELGPCDDGTQVAEVWIDREGLVRQMRLDQKAMTMDIEFFDFGVPVEVEPPPAEQVIDQPVDMPDLCAPGQAKPLRVDQVLAALRRNGFPARMDEDACFEPVAAYLMVEDEPATLWCYLMTSPDGGADFALTSLGGPPEAGKRSVANVGCTLYAKPTDAGEALERLDAAFAELRRELRE